MLSSGQLLAGFISLLCGGIHSTKEIILPVLPPTLLSALYAEEPTFETVEPAELCTLLRPSEAFDTACLPVS